MKAHKSRIASKAYDSFGINTKYVCNGHPMYIMLLQTLLKWSELQNMKVIRECKRETKDTKCTIELIGQK